MNVLLIGQATENTATAALIRRGTGKTASIYCFGGKLLSDKVSHNLLVPPEATISAVIKAALKERINQVILTTEAAVVAGYANAFSTIRVPCFGPTTIAAHFRYDREDREMLFKEIGCKNLSESVHHSVGELGDFLLHHNTKAEVVIRAVYRDGRIQTYPCRSLTQIANAVYILESQPDIHHYSHFFVERLVEGSRSIYTALVNGTHLQAIGRSSEVKDQITTRLARPMLSNLKQQGIDYCGWLIVDVLLGEKEIFVGEVNCAPRPEVVIKLADTSDFDFLQHISELNARTSGLLPQSPHPQKNGLAQDLEIA